jgi:TonB family protein
MKTDRLYSSLVFSLCLHSLLVVAAVVYMMHSGVHYKAATLVVSLVDFSSDSPSSSPAAQKTAEVPAPPKEKSIHMTEKSEKVTTKEKSEANERIAALEAKKKIQTMQRLRKTVTVSTTKGTAGTKVTTTGSGSPGGADYITLVGTKIRENFRIPESMDKDLKGAINIRISKNGSITLIGFEKKSGNLLFDRAAIRAINLTTSVPPPQGEMEIEVRFSPIER